MESISQKITLWYTKLRDLSSRTWLRGGGNDIRDERVQKTLLMEDIKWLNEESFYTQRRVDFSVMDIM